jgi:FkbM family methyltransferase
MIEIVLRFLTNLAMQVRFLMPVVMNLSMYYLTKKYRKAFLEKNQVEGAYQLRHLALLRQKLHPPTESFIVDVKVNNVIPLQVNICQQYCGDLYYGIGFEKDELNLVRKFVRAGDMFFDVGANVGIYTLAASRLVGDEGQVHSFEPLINTFDLLKRNVDLNHAQNVHLNPVAVGDIVGEVNLYVNAQSAFTGLGRTNRGSLLDVQKVPVWTLDHYAEREGIQSIDFLKVDVEGFEGHVLRGAAELLLRSPKLIVMSELAKKNFEPLGFSVKEVIDHVRGLGFEVWMIRNGGKGLQYIPSNSFSYPFQNFIFMRRSNEKYSLLKDIK